jgi:hypothetical protein
LTLTHDELVEHVRDQGLACEDCGAGAGGRISGPWHRKTGVSMQGALTPGTNDVAYSPTLDAVLCTRCWRPRFYGRPR